MHFCKTIFYWSEQIIFSFQIPKVCWKEGRLLDKKRGNYVLQSTHLLILLHMCFDRFLLAVESRDLSQADKSITRASSFPSFKFWMINYSYTQKSYLALWQNCFGQFITQKFPSLKSKQFSQFFLVRGRSQRIDKI